MNPKIVFQASKQTSTATSLQQSQVKKAASGNQEVLQSTVQRGLVRKVVHHVPSGQSTSKTVRQPKNLTSSNTGSIQRVIKQSTASSVSSASTDYSVSSLQDQPTTSTYSSTGAQVIAVCIQFLSSCSCEELGCVNVWSV